MLHILFQVIYLYPMHCYRISSFLLALTTFASAQSSLKLIPIPREVHAGADSPLPRGVRVVCAAPCATEDQFAADDLKAALLARNIAVTEADGFPVELMRLATHPDERFTDEMKAEGYAIHTASSGLTVVGDTATGVFYGAQTVKQLIEGDGKRAVLRGVNIRDWPAMKYRGLDDDISRGPITTLEFEKKMIRTIAAYKVNLYSPYFEHTQQYAVESVDGAAGQQLRQRRLLSWLRMPSSTTSRLFRSRRRLGISTTA